jgi:PAS domain S-box-containing protein
MSNQGQRVRYQESETAQLEEVLGRIVSVMSSANSPAFFDVFSEEVAHLLAASWVFVGKTETYPAATLQGQCQWYDGKAEEAPTFPVGATPFESLLNGGGEVVWLVGEEATALSGLSPFHHMAVDSVAGVAITDAMANVVGVLAVGGDGDFGESAFGNTLMRLFASCAAGELLRRRDDQESQSLVADLRHRMRELSCFYGLTESIRTRESMREVCQDVAALVPEAWHYPDIARARVALDGVEYVSQPFENTQWGMSAAVMAGDRARGSIQVFYAEIRDWDSMTGPFLPSERNLLDAVARTLGEAIEKREGEKAIREQSVVLARERNRLETILRSIGDGVVVTDGSDRIMLINPAAMELLGTGEDGLLGTNFLHHIEDEEFKAAWRKTATLDSNLINTVLKVQQPVQRALTATRTRIPRLVHDADGHVTILHDITKEREIDQMKADFVSSVSHELRTPMTSIKGFASTLLRNPNLEPERRTRFLSIVSEEAERLLSLIEQMLLISRMDAGPLSLELTHVDLSGMIKRVTDAQEPEAKRKHIDVKTDVPEGLPAPRADQEKIHIVLSNLVGNALKFTPEGGRVQICAAVEEDAVIIEVADSGIGMPKRAQAEVFDRFYRVHRPGATHAGTGLGLFIVREIVKLHGGWIDVESGVDQGTRFTFRLPLDGPGPAAQSSGDADGNERP